MSLKKTKIKAAVLTLGFIAVFAAGILVGKSRGIPFIHKQHGYSIGIYSGKSPFELRPAANAKNPVISAKSVTDISAEFTADPFMLIEDNTWYMFFEVMNTSTNQGDIGLAVSNDGFSWTYKQIVLDEPFHLSYPYVFKWDNKFYMIPESVQAGSIRLYEATDFPLKWSFVKDLIKGEYVDSSILRYDEQWWLFTSQTRNDVLHLFYAKELTGTWTEHPESPIIRGDAHIARPGGRVVIYDGRPVRFAQDCYPEYGLQVQAFLITELTTKSYKEEKASLNPILTGSGSGWNAQRMHNVDPHQIDDNQWIACVDGYRQVIAFSLKF